MSQGASWRKSRSRTSVIQVWQCETAEGLKGNKSSSRWNKGP